MSIFKEPQSRNPNQLSFDVRPTYQKLGTGIICLVFGLVCLPLATYAFIKSFLPLIDMLAGEDLININYLGLFCGGAALFSFVFFFAAYSCLIHKRVIIPSELKEKYKKLFFLAFKSSIFFFAFIGPLLSITSIVLVQVYDYSWCPQLSQGSGWDSWWVRDQQLCTSYK